MNATFLEKWGHASGVIYKHAADDDVILSQAVGDVEGTVEVLVSSLCLDRVALYGVGATELEPAKANSRHWRSVDVTVHQMTRPSAGMTVKRASAYGNSL